MTTFEQLGLSEEILKVLLELGFEQPTDIQEKAIPQLLAEDRDFIGLAQTGTGKTAAFGLPLLERLDPAVQATQGLILAPTRELGKQIAEQLHIFSRYMEKISVLPVYGGANIVNQIKALKRTQHVIIATPGRLIDLIKRRAVHLDQLQFLVLDEADEMLNMGFKEELDTILSYTPAEKLTWLFSATMPPQIKKIVNTYMDNPLEVKINPKNEVNANITHQFAIVHPRNKVEALARFLDTQEELRGVVFCRTKRDTQDLAEALLRRGYRADALHGDLSQHQRDRVMKRFKNHQLTVLIATDVAARGIDVNDLTHVFHFNLPDDIAYYTHRSGRTARAGKKGLSIAFIGRDERYRVRRLEQVLKIRFEKTLIPSVSDIAEIRIQQWSKDILSTDTETGVDEDLYEYVRLTFGDLTKEELIAKILQHQVNSLNLGTERDLNEAFMVKKSSRRGGGKDRYRGGRSRDRGDRYQDKGRSRGGRYKSKDGDSRFEGKTKSGKKKVFRMKKKRS